MEHSFPLALLADHTPISVAVDGLLFDKLILSDESLFNHSPRRTFSLDYQPGSSLTPLFLKEFRDHYDQAPNVALLRRSIPRVWIILLLFLVVITQPA